MKYILIIFLFFSCKVTENTYRKVATDTKVTSEKKSIIAPWVSVYFPVSNEVIKGDDVITVDTMWVAYSYTDTIKESYPVREVITKTIKRVDTVKTEDYSKLLIARREATQLHAEVIIEQSLRRQAEIDLSKIKEGRRNLIIWIIILALANIVQVYFKIRKLW